MIDDIEAGYIKNPENKKQWIIESEAAEIVRRIYRMCLDGTGNETIARILQEEKIENPMASARTELSK